MSLFHAPAATSSSPDDEPAGAGPTAAADAGDDDVGLHQLLSNLDGAAQAEPAPQSGPAAVSESISIEMEALQVGRLRLAPDLDGSHDIESAAQAGPAAVLESFTKLEALQVVLLNCFLAESASSEVSLKCTTRACGSNRTKASSPPALRGGRIEVMLVRLALGVQGSSEGNQAAQPEKPFHSLPACCMSSLRCIPGMWSGKGPASIPATVSIVTKIAVLKARLPAAPLSGAYIAKRAWE